jgi:mono/diheme cytochrome c family protein
MVLVAQPARAQEKAANEQGMKGYEHGMKVYAAQKCGICHSLQGKGAKKGPLDGVASKLTVDEIRHWIVDAPEMTKKTKATRKPLMKSYAHLPKDDVEALVAYLSSLKG